MGFGKKLIMPASALKNAKLNPSPDKYTFES